METENIGRMRSTARWVTTSLASVLAAIILAFVEVIPWAVVFFPSVIAILFCVRFYFMVRHADDDDWKSVK